MDIKLEVVRVEVAFMRNGEMHRESEVFQKPKRLTDAKLLERVRAKYGVHSMVVRSDLKEVELDVSDGDVVAALDQPAEQ